MKRTYIRPASAPAELHAEGHLLKSSYIPVSGDKTDYIQYMIPSEAIVQVTAYLTINI